MINVVSYKPYYFSTLRSPEMEPQRETPLWKSNVILLTQKGIEIISPFQCGPPNNKMHYAVATGLFYRSIFYWLVWRSVTPKGNFKFLCHAFLCDKSLAPVWRLPGQSLRSHLAALCQGVILKEFMDERDYYGVLIQMLRVYKPSPEYH